MASPAQLHKEISAGKFKPAYYFFGSEDYRITEAEKYVAREFLPNLQLSVNFRRFDGRRTKAGDLIAQLSNLPMLGEKQVFVVTDFQSFRPTEVKAILALLTPSDPNRIIIFDSPASKAPNKKSAFFTSVSSVAEVVEFKRLDFDESVRTIRARLKAEGIEIADDALRLLTELLDGNRGAMESELNKLVNFKSAGETIELEDIRKISAGYEMFSIFDLADLIVAANTKKILRMLKQLLAEGVSPVTFTTLLQQHFTSLYLVKNGKPPLGNRGFLVYKFRQQAAKFDNRQLEDMIIEIADADSSLRHQELLKQEVVLETLALALAGGKR